MAHTRPRLLLRTHVYIYTDVHTAQRSAHGSRDPTFHYETLSKFAKKIKSLTGRKFVEERAIRGDTSDLMTDLMVVY